MRRRLVAMVVSGSLAAVLAFGLPLAITAKLLVERRVFGEAELRARVVAAVLDEVADVDEADDALRRVDGAADGPGVSVVYDDGRQWGVPLSHDHAVRARAAVVDGPDGDGDDGARVHADGATLVVEGFSTSGDHLPEGVVVVEVPGRLVTRDLDQWWWAIGITAVVLFAISAGSADRLGRSIVRPVLALVAVSDRLRHGELDARVRPEGPPELVQLGYALNLLAERIGQLVSRERERVSDLSHRLRTPVTALHLDAESLRDDDERARLVSRVTRMERAIDRVVGEARDLSRSEASGSSDLAEVVDERVAFWRPLFDDQGRRFTVERARGVVGPVVVGVPRAELVALIDELLGNAVTHTAPGIAVGVELAPAGPGRVRLEVADAGTGFPDLAVMGRGVSGAGSTGLGLDIVRRTAEAADGSVELGRSRSGGASVRVELPLLGGPVVGG